jgi:hypothetical protein
MLIGVDFDNTLVCYDRLFHRLALERGLIPPQLPAVKDVVRDFLRQAGREEAWTELQGHAYGARIGDAVLFPGAREFLLEARRRRVPLCVISHKTRLPVRGPQVDLHQAARTWCVRQRFFDPDGIGLTPRRLFFEETQGAKVRRIARERCTHFVDDLVEFLQHPEFPTGVERILFDPWARHGGAVPFACWPSWQAVQVHLFGEA